MSRHVVHRVVHKACVDHADIVECAVDESEVGGIDRLQADIVECGIVQSEVGQVVEQWDADVVEESDVLPHSVVQGDIVVNGAIDGDVPLGKVESGYVDHAVVVSRHVVHRVVHKACVDHADIVECAVDESEVGGIDRLQADIVECGIVQSEVGQVVEQWDADVIKESDVLPHGVVQCHIAVDGAIDGDVPLGKVEGSDINESVVGDCGVEHRHIDHGSVDQG